MYLSLKSFLISFLLIFAVTASAQKIRPQIKKIARELSKFEELTDEGSTIGEQPQYKLFKKLRAEATTEELLSLTKNKSDIVKGYSAWALADNRYKKIDDIFLQFLKSNDNVTTHEGCIVSTDDLASQVYYRVLYQKHVNEISREDEQVFLELTQKMDRILLYNYPDKSISFNAFQNNKANPDNYTIIRKLALKDTIYEALVELAKYQKTEDIVSIKEQGEKAFLAIASFPDNAFWHFLMQYKEKSRSLEYFLSLTAYKDTRSLETIMNIYKGCNTNEISRLDEALIKNYCPIYQNMILTIWEDHNMIDLTATQKLLADCPERAALSFAKGLETDNKLWLRELDMNYGTRDSILPLIIKNVSQYQKHRLPEICNRHIFISTFQELEDFLDYIEANGLVETTPNLIKRLEEKDDRAFEIFHISKTLLSFRNAETDSRLIKLLKSKQEKWDWGNWSEHFKKTFEEYNIDINK